MFARRPSCLNIPEKVLHRSEFSGSSDREFWPALDAVTRGAQSETVTGGLKREGFPNARVLGVFRSGRINLTIRAMFPLLNDRRGIGGPYRYSVLLDAHGCWR